MNGNGVLIGLLTAPPLSLATYATMPIPGGAFYWFLDGMLVAVCAGMRSLDLSHRRAASGCGLCP